MQLFRSDDPQHIETAELLPWFATGTLDPMEQTKVEQHLMECITCRNELRNIRAMAVKIAATDDSDPAAIFGFSRLKARIEQIESGQGQRVSIRTLAAQWLSSNPWIKGAMLAQTAMILALASYAFLTNPTPQYYHTLAATPAPAATRAKIVVVFDNASAERKIRDLLMHVNARITDGPTSEGAYTLEVARDRQREILEELRRQSIVTLAEPERLR
jgi:hypothetical protein